MLILTRRIGETIMIGDDVSITVLSVKGTQVRLGTAAPKSVTVHREEVYRKIKTDQSEVISASDDNEENIITV